MKNFMTTIVFFTFLGLASYEFYTNSLKDMKEDSDFIAIISQKSEPIKQDTQKIFDFSNFEARD